MSEVIYKLNDPEEVQWCNSHQRRARYLCCKPDGSVMPDCGPNLSGILLPCFCVRLNGIAEIEELVIERVKNEQFCAHGVTSSTAGFQPDSGGANPTCALQIEATVPNAVMKLQPTTLRKANDFVAEHHRHNGRTARNGGKWACSVEIDGKTVGVAIVGNPISATLMDGYTAEVLRVCTIGSAAKGACSMLYMACWRAWKAMGGRRMITYTLESEPGASLRGAGWKVVGKTKPCKPGWRKNDKCNETRTYSPVMGLVKNRWQKSE